MNITQTLLPSAVVSALVRLLLPAATDLRFDYLDLTEDQGLTLALAATQPTAPCPRCDQPATRIQSRYIRTLADLPWSGRPIRLHLQVRRFCCANPACPRAIFTERLPQVALPYARRTTRLAEELRQIGFTLGGEAGARRTAQQGIAVSPATLLRLVRRAATPAAGTPRVVGIDDWALRKGHRYGTIVVDLERHTPIDLLPDRTAETVAAWFRDHPEVEIISRDRAGAYAEGATLGAPDAVQVADRWHLIQNLAEALIQVLEAHQELLQQTLMDAPTTAPPDASALPGEQPAQATPTEVRTPVPPSGDTAAPDPAPTPPAGAPPVPRTQAAQRQQQRHARRRARYAEVCALHQQGWTLSAIADHVGLHRDTVRRYVQAPTVPERQRRPPRASILDPYKPYVLERWQAGGHTGAVLLREIQARGYTGSASLLFAYLGLIRQLQGVPPGKRTGGGMGTVTDPTVRPPTPRNLAWLILRRPETLDATEQARVAQVRESHPDLETAITLAQAFTLMVRERQHALLDEWLEQATASDLGAFRNFAASLRRDYAAVKAGVTLEWSNGPVEGEINRLKQLKRQMYGRAKLDLLRQRVLAA